MLFHHLIKLRTHRADGTERAACALKDHAELRPVQKAQLLLRQIEKIFSLVENIASGNRAGTSKKTHCGLEQCGFSAAAFARDPENFSLIEREADILHSGCAVVRNVDLIVSQ